MEKQEKAQEAQKGQPRAGKKKLKAKNLRAIVIVAVALVIAVGYFTAFGIGNLSGLGWDAFSVLCPLGYLESLLASKTFVPRALISFVIIVALVLVLGRVFCAWICPMPLMQRIFPGFKGKKGKKGGKAGAAGTAGPEAAAASPDAVAATVSEAVAVDDAGDGPAAQAAEPPEETAAEKPGKKKPNWFKLDSRFGVLLGALASAAIFGFPVFCLICPVGLAFATVYLVMRLFAFGETTWTIIVVPLVLLVEVLFFRKWCSKFCPLGAIMSLISSGNKTFRPTIDDSKCINKKTGKACYVCSKTCPVDIDIRRPEISESALANCTKCRECAEHCPGHAITFPAIPKKRAGQAGKAD